METRNHLNGAYPKSQMSRLQNTSIIMSGKKARGSWDSNDKRTRAGKSSNSYHPHKDTDAFMNFAGGMLKSGFNSLGSKSKSKNSRVSEVEFSENSKGSASNYALSEEEKAEQIKKDKKSLPLIIGLSLVGLILVIWFWIWIVSVLF